MLRLALLVWTLSLPSCRALLYHPTETSAEERARIASAPGWREAAIERGDVTLQGLTRPPAGQEARWILFFGGNATSLAASQRLLERVRGDEDIGLAVFAYRGYDGSGGRPTQRALTDDGVVAVRTLERELGVGSGRLAVVGHSLGASVAAHVARHLEDDGRPPAALVLLAPFRSVPRVARQHVWCAVPCLFPDAWKTERIAPRFRVPVLVLHGADDAVVPVAHGRAIAAAIPGARFLEIPGRGHDDLLTSDAARQVREFVRQPGD